MSAGAAATRHRHSPRVRRLARERGIALDSITGTGPHARVTPADVLRTAPVPAIPPASPPATGVPAAAAVVEVELTRARRLAESGGPAVEGQLAAAVLAALRRHPTLAAGGRGQHLGVAAGAARTGAVIQDAGDLNAAALARRLAMAATTPSAGGATPPAGVAATFTLVLASGGATSFEVPAIPTGQVAALAVGAVLPRPVAVPDRDGELVVAIRPVSQLCLAYDTRAVEPAQAAAFLAAVRDRLAGTGVGR